MKKFFAVTILVVTLLLCENPAQAADVRLCDCSVETVISKLNRAAAKLNTSIWGKEYYTYQGARRCELHFGNSRENTIRFRLNNDDTVARALITMQTTESAMDDSSIQAAFLAGVILSTAGMSESEIFTLHDEAIEKMYPALERNPTHYHGKTSLWCSSIQRYVVWDCEVSDKPELHFDIYLYAHD